MPATRLLVSSFSMWCRICQQDVPAIASKTGEGVVCAQCHGKERQREETTPAEAPDAEASSAEPTPLQRRPPPAEDWNLDADLAAVTRRLQSLRRDSGGPVAPPHFPPHSPIAATPPLPRPAPRTHARRGTWLAWPVLMAGMMAFTCGGVLLGWSFIAGRGDLWTFGMPAVLGGQALLVLGLVLQLEGLWQNNRETRETLAGLDRDLAELRHATAMLTTSHTSSSTSFYAHMAEGASPHLLLADVKGQLDLLATRLSQASER